MKSLHWLALFCCFVRIVSFAADADPKESPAEVKDQIQGKWQGARGTFTTKDFLTFKKYEKFAPGTAGDYTFTQLRSGLTGTDGKKLPTTEIVAGVGGYSAEGNKLTFLPGTLPGPVGKEKVVWEVVKVTDDTLEFKTDKGKTEEFKRAK
jgi:hypothetical protein